MAVPRWTARLIAPLVVRAYPGMVGVTLMEEYEECGRRQTLEAGIALLRAALARAPAHGDERAVRLSDLGIALRLGFEVTNDVSLLLEAEAVGRAALSEISPGAPLRSAVMMNLSSTLSKAAEHRGDVSLAAEAVGMCREAVDVAAAGSVDWAEFQAELGRALLMQFTLTRHLPPLDEAAGLLRSAAAALPLAHPTRAKALGNLTIVLEKLAELTGDSSLLVEAVAVGWDALDAAPPGHRAQHLSSLAAVLLRVALRAEPSIVPDNVPDGKRSAHLIGRSAGDRIALVAEALDMRRMALLVDALDLAREAVSLTPPGHSNHPLYLDRLGNILVVAARPTGLTGEARTTADGKTSADLLREAERVLRAAVDAISIDHPSRVVILGDLSLVLLAAARVTTGNGRPVEVMPGSGSGNAGVVQLTDAARVAREALQAVPTGHPERAVFQVNMGSILRELAKYVDGPRAEAHDLDLAASADAGAPLLSRIIAYRRIALDATEERDGPTALAAIESAIAIAGQVAPRTLARRDREHWLMRLDGLASQAAAVAVSAGAPHSAVEFLEQARGMLIADSLDARSGELARLAVARPDLAESVKALRDRREALEAADSAQPAAIRLDHEASFGAARSLAAERLAVNGAWDALMDQIRAIEGFGRFFGPSRAADLAMLAREGPVVLVYVTQDRCDALAVTDRTSGPVRLIPLPALRLSDVADHAGRMLDAHQYGYHGEQGRAAQADVSRSLEWMWDTIAEPVLDALGYDRSPPPGEWPRLWWCPVGPVAYLPLHAAGYHEDPAGRSVMDRVASSYTPTLRSLAYARFGGTTTASELIAAEAVIVGASAVPGQVVLPRVGSEIQVVNALLPGSRVLEDPTKANVLAALAKYPVAHFACHGQTDWVNPAASHLVLPDYATEPLTVTDVSRQRVAGYLAYLSACSTAVTAPDLTDESIHVTSAFHLAGYKHVIGTLWPVNDVYAARVAKDFYIRLTCRGTEAEGTPEPAEALHDAMRALRARIPAAPGIWAAYVHVGS